MSELEIEEMGRIIQSFQERLEAEMAAERVRYYAWLKERLSTWPGKKVEKYLVEQEAASLKYQRMSDMLWREFKGYPQVNYQWRALCNWFSGITFRVREAFNVLRGEWP